jgi:hypothetical protein
MISSVRSLTVTKHCFSNTLAGDGGARRLVDGDPFPGDYKMPFSKLARC